MIRLYQHRLIVTDVPEVTGARVVVFEKVYRLRRNAEAAKARWLAGGAWSHRAAAITAEPTEKGGNL